jgi:hypothetical protein
MSVVSLDMLRSQLADLRGKRGALREELERTFQKFSTVSEESELAIKEFRDKIEAVRIQETDRSENDFDPRIHISNLKGELPILLFPLRVQTRFTDTADGRSLLVRVYPDDILVQSHDSKLTENEKAVGDQLWSAPEKKKDLETQSQVEIWRGIVGQFGLRRAAWIRHATNPQLPQKPDVVQSLLRIPAVWTLPERLVFRLYGLDDRLVIPEMVGKSIPDGLEMGFDPTRPNMGFLREESDFEYPPELRWQSDFTEAEKVGMGITIPLGQLGTIRKFERLLVLGVRLSSDEKTSTGLLEKLIDDHSYSNGFCIVPQGTPTNVTEDRDVPSEPDPDDFLERLRNDGALPKKEDLKNIRYEDESDGLRLAHALGISPEVMRYVDHADQKDGLQSIAMKRALWAGTLGYYVQQMLSPYFDNSKIDDPNYGERLMLAARFFFTHFVFGRGPLPAIRVGDQPYGILPVSGDMLQTATDRLPSWDEPFVDGFTDLLQEKIIILSHAWSDASTKIPRAGTVPNANERLIEILGLQPSSSEYRSERLVGLEYLKNYVDFKNDVKKKAALDSLDQLLESRYKLFNDKFPKLFGEEEPRIFKELVFFGAFWSQIVAGAKDLNRVLVPPLSGDVIDNLPPSETSSIKDEYPNYIKQLAEDTFADVRKGIQRIGKDGKTEPVTALLYMLLRHSYLYEYAFMAMRLHHHLNGTPWSEFREKDLYNILFEFDHTYWDWLETKVNWPQFAVVAVEVALPHPTALQVIVARDKFREELGTNWSQIFGDIDELHRALKVLQDVHTAPLERLFGEHIDLAGYRLDAWLTGLAYQRLIAFRVWSEDTRAERLHPLYPEQSDRLLHTFGRTVASPLLRYDLNHRPIEEYSHGIYLGAFGWVENIEADLTPTVVDELPDDLRPKSGRPVTRDTDNYGLIHAPSLNQAVTAALLRSASVTQPDKTAFNIDLSSARVREALWIIEGVGNGQPTAALFGYKFERGLREHDIKLLQYLPDLRKQFPMPRPAETDAGPAESIPVKDVVNGLRIIQARRNGELDSLISGFILISDHRKIIENLADKILDTLDACGDLMLAESVHQAAQGNYERAGGSVTASGEFTHIPSEFEVIDTPRSGTSITHRVLIGLNEESPEPLAKTARARLEPKLNAWINSLLGPLNKLGCGLSYIFQESEKEKRAKYIVTLAEFDLEPIDLMYVFDQSSISEIAGRLNLVTRTRFDIDHPGKKVEGVEVEFFTTGKASIRPIGELLPFLGQVRKLLAEARPATQRDFLPPNALHGQDQAKVDAIDDKELVERTLGITKEAPGVIRVGSLWSAFEAAMKSLELLDGLDAKGIRALLLKTSEFNIPQAAPNIAADSAEPLKEQIKVLQEQVAHIKEIMKLRLNDAEEKWKSRLPDDKKDLKPLQFPEGNLLTLCREITNTLLGSSFPLLPRIKLTKDIRDLLVSAALPKLTPTSDIEDWLFSASTVRENAARLQNTRVLAASTVGEFPRMQVFQWPADNKNWVANPLPEKAVMSGDLISIVVQAAGTFDVTKPISGLLLDEWHELIPNSTETTGISFHYDAPNAVPPQALLLAVSERRRDNHGQWSWDELVRCVDQSLTLAKMRAVGPDELRQTPLDTVLPATMAAEAASPATISTSFHANISDRIASNYSEIWKKT